MPPIIVQHLSLSQERVELREAQMAGPLDLALAGCQGLEGEPHISFDPSLRRTDLRGWPR
jgi:hypothetical protein